MTKNPPKVEITGLTSISSFGPLAQAGGKIRLGGDPRSVIRHITRVDSDTQLQMSTYIRPSRGYAKHIRRKKSNAH